MRTRRCSGESTRNRPPNDQYAWPPSDASGSWSTRITRRPASASSAVATRPARPAPTTMTSASMFTPPGSPNVTTGASRSGVAAKLSWQVMTKEAREAVVRELAPAVPAVGAALVDEVRAAIPAYRQLHPSQTAEIAAIATWALGRVVEVWASGGTGLTERDLARFRGIGAARARDGRPLTAVLRAYRVAAGQAIDAVVGHGRGRLDADDVVALAKLWLASMDELSEAVFAGYSAAA